MVYENPKTEMGEDHAEFQLTATSREDIYLFATKSGEYDRSVWFELEVRNSNEKAGLTLEYEDLNKLTNSRSQTPVENLLRSVMHGSITDDVYRQIIYAVGKVRDWFPDPSEESERIPPPDFTRDIPLKLPLFGYIEHHSGNYLTEGFWAIPQGRKDPQVYSLILEEDSEKAKPSKPSKPSKGQRNDIQHIEAFEDPERFEFKKHILPPSFDERWLVSRKTVEKLVNGSIVSREEMNDMFEFIYNTVIPRHLWIPDEGEKKTLAYWIIATYFYDIFDAFPIGHGWGFYGSGKSRLGMLVVATAYHGMFGVDITSADFFRSKEEFRPTIVVDENEEIKRDYSTIRDQLINGSYVRGGGYVSRRRGMETDSGKIYVRDKFNLYSPTFLCSINPVRTPAGRSRIIIFPMVKKNVNVPIAERSNYRDLQRDMYLARFSNWVAMKELYRWMRGIGVKKEIKKGGETITKEIRARDLELWLPIFTVMRYIDRWDEDFNDVFRFQEKIKRYKIELDQADEERPTLYRSIAKIYYEEKQNPYDPRYPEDGRWCRHPNDNEKLYEWEVRDLANIMKQIGNSIGYKKNITSTSVGKSLSMLGFEKSNHPGNRRTTFIINIDRFRHICLDHIGYEIDELGSWDYDSRKSQAVWSPPAE